MRVRREKSRTPALQTIIVIDEFRVRIVANRGERYFVSFSSENRQVKKKRKKNKNKKKEGEKEGDEFLFSRRRLAIPRGANIVIIHITLFVERQIYRNVHCHYYFLRIKEP